MDEAAEITQCLMRWADGEAGAEDQLMRLMLPELRRLARRSMRKERSDHTLQPTALVNEAYLRLIDSRQMRWQDRSHFLAMAARVMRHIMVDHARRRLTAKREGMAYSVSLEDFEGNLPEQAETPEEVVALNDALDEFAKLDPRKAKVVELRFFGGLSVEETAEILAISPNTVIRDWGLARAWLLRELRSEGR
jgi:RNA polymerase sigma factor (TIGR02999 family)